MEPVSGWGPSHHEAQQRPNRFIRAVRWIARALLGIDIFELTASGPYRAHLGGIVGVAELAGLALIALPAPTQKRMSILLRHQISGMGLRAERKEVLPADPLMTERRRALSSGGGVYLGIADDDAARYGRSERAVLLLGPPRAGKTSSVIIPSLISHTGPAISTSTKTDVVAATIGVRGADGQAWVFDPTGRAGGHINGVQELRWSPVTSSISWDGALLMARAMTVKIGSGASDRSHWASRAQALLAPLLHAAAVHGRDMESVVDWVMRHVLDDAGVLLEDQRCSKLAFGSLLGILNTENRERSSIFSATADALEAYTSESALTAARNPNFDAHAFVRSPDTIYIHAPAEDQAAAAPIVCGLLSEIRRATYQAASAGQLASGRMLFALDEAANIAPLDELPQIASEGGGQGLILLAAFQDLSQARQRWGAQADGFLTLFGTKLILPGIADTRTLDAISQMLGEYDRQVVSHNRPNPRFQDVVSGTIRPHNSTTFSTQRTRVLSAGEIANIPAGHGLHLDGVHWELVTLTPAHVSEPWRSLTTRHT
jgi:type IV secretion system protein VirD4